MTFWCPHPLFVRSSLVDVRGFEALTPCLQSRQDKTLIALSGVAHTENRRNFRSLNCPELGSPKAGSSTYAAIIFIWLAEFGMHGGFDCPALQELRPLLWLIAQDGRRSFG